jgi:hypothetical protein
MASHTNEVLGGVRPDRTLELSGKLIVPLGHVG